MKLLYKNFFMIINIHWLILFIITLFSYHKNKIHFRRKICNILYTEHNMIRIILYCYKNLYLSLRINHLCWLKLKTSFIIFMQIVHSFTHLHKNLIICFATNKKSYQREIQDNCSKFNNKDLIIDHLSLI